MSVEWAVAVPWAGSRPSESGSVRRQRGVGNLLTERFSEKPEARTIGPPTDHLNTVRRGKDGKEMAGYKRCRLCGSEPEIKDRTDKECRISTH